MISLWRVWEFGLGMVHTRRRNVRPRGKRNWSPHYDGGYDNGLKGLPRPRQVMWKESTCHDAVRSGRRR